MNGELFAGVPITEPVRLPEPLDSVEREHCTHSDINPDTHRCWACDQYLCDHCGEFGGDPVEYESREFQGCAEHGGMVTSVDRMCTKCARRAA